MAYSFPVFRKGMVFKTVRLVTPKEAAKIADKIKNDYQLYNSAFISALEHNNGSIVWEKLTEQFHETERIQQYVKESYIFNFPLIVFRYNGFSIQARNSVTVCRHKHRSKIWTRLSCAGFGEDKTNLDSGDVQKFFKFAEANVDRILTSLAGTYLQHAKAAGVSIPKSGAYFFKLRAFNSTSNTSRILLNKLQSGLAVTEALNDRRFRAELLDYFQIALGMKTNSQIKKGIKTGGFEIFGYKSANHEALFTARVTKEQTDVCGFGFDDHSELKHTVFSHAATRDLLKEYAQNF